MMRTFLSDTFLSSSSSEDELSINSDDSTSSSSTMLKSSMHTEKNEIDTRSTKRQNVILKLYNRERTGYFAESPMQKIRQTAFKTVPSRLSFCLKDIVPYCYLKGHVFMGLTACGQFLISYKFEFDVSDHNYDFSPCCKYELFFWIYRPHNLLVKYYKICLFDDHGVDNLKTVSMTQWTTNMGIVVVHGTSESDVGDSYVTIVSVPKLGCIDCRQLRDEYYNDSLDGIRSGALCIRCNLTVHMKYSRSESDPKFEPQINLNCPDRILIFSHGLIHMININLELNKPLKLCSNSIDISYISKKDCRTACVTSFDEQLSEMNLTQTSIDDSTLHELNATISQDAIETVPLLHEKTKPETIVARIIADFAECETVDSPSQEKYTRFERYSPITPSTSSSSRQFDELVITCGSSSNSNYTQTNDSQTNTTKGGITSASSSLSSAASSSNNRVRLISHRSHRQIAADNLIKTAGNIKTIDLQSNSSTIQTTGNKNLDKAAKAYEFSEDNEKCEKISIFRKRRLAEKKYEFSEDNSENIIPFAKLRSTTAMKSFSLRARQQAAAAAAASLSPISHHSGNAAGQNLDIAGTLPLQPPPPHTHRASPSHGFRSPCGSPVGNRYIMSPPGRTSTNSVGFCGRSPTYTKPFSSPHRHIGAKHTYYDAIAIENPLLSPRSISGGDVENFDGKSNSGSGSTPLSEVKPSNIYVMFAPTTLTNIGSTLNAIEKCVGEKDDKPNCSKKLIRRYVEEDDATSVITSEEDDCISAGYHTSLPVEVHGACYSNMQMISHMTYQKLKCPSVIITQHTFDLETLTYYIANHLCSMNNKKYVFFYDWAYEPVNVCPLSSHLTSILIVRFAAFELKSQQNTINNKLCANSSCNQSIDCAFHRKNYECSALFTWNIDTGDWNVLDYGDLIEVSPATVYKHSNDLNNAVKQLTNDFWHPSFGNNRYDTTETNNDSNVCSNNNSSNNSNCDIFSNLRILDSCTDKSKEALTDYDNSIQFVRSAKNVTQYFNIFSSSASDY